MTTSAALPPGPRAPRAVQLGWVMRDEAGLLERSQARYGDLFRLHFERRPWFMVAHPDAIKQVFQAPPEVVHAGDANEILRPSLGASSVLLLDEGEHLRQRKLLLPAFHGDRLRAQRERMERVAAAQVERFPEGRPFALRDETQRIALEVILQVVLGLEPDDPAHDRLARPFLSFLDWFADTKHLLLPTVLGPDHTIVRRLQNRNAAAVNRELYGLIAERRGAPGLADREDVLSMLLLAHDEDGRPMSDREIRDEVVTLLVAGHETTATALAWAFERLTRDPAALRRLEEEAADPEGDAAYAEAACKEALRLRPVLMNVLRTVYHRRLEVGGFTFPVGSVLAPSIYLVQRRHELWGADAAVFRPERWLESGVPSYAWIPFGGGVRRCIGASFALMEMEVVMRAIARAVHLEPVGEDEPPVARFITVSPARGAQVRVAGHRSPAAPGEPLVVVG